jgi:hypothetical protein
MILNDPEKQSIFVCLSFSIDLCREINKIKLSVNNISISNKINI